MLTRTEFTQLAAAGLAAQSPLAEWTTAFMTVMFRKMELLFDATPGADVGLQLHDPLTVWHLVTAARAGDERLTLGPPVDVRVETRGQWTRGMCIVDRRSLKKLPPETAGAVHGQPVHDVGDPGELVLASDHGGWLAPNGGNRVRIAVYSPGRDAFASDMLKRIFSLPS